LEPSETITDDESAPAGFRPVGTARVKRRAKEQACRSCWHNRWNGLVLRQELITEHVVAARPDPCGAILHSKVVERPHHVDHVFDALFAATPHVLVAVWPLGGSARMNFDALGQV